MKTRFILILASLFFSTQGLAGDFERISIEEISNTRLRAATEAWSYLSEPVAYGVDYDFFAFDSTFLRMPKSDFMEASLRSTTFYEPDSDQYQFDEVKDPDLRLEKVAEMLDENFEKGAALKEAFLKLIEGLEENLSVRFFIGPVHTDTDDVYVLLTFVDTEHSQVFHFLGTDY